MTHTQQWLALAAFQLAVALAALAWDRPIVPQAEFTVLAAADPTPDIAAQCRHQCVAATADIAKRLQCFAECMAGRPRPRP